jgi:fused signal recognition particle receptor
MVFDWFRRTAADAEIAPQAAEDAALEAPESGSEGTLSAVNPPPDAQAGEGDAVWAPVVDAPSQDRDSHGMADGEASAAVVPPAVGAVDEAALEWARQAYARLKAQQQSLQAGSAAPSSPAVEAPAPTVLPSPPVEASVDASGSTAGPESLTPPPSPPTPLPLPAAPAEAEPADGPPPGSALLPVQSQPSDPGLSAPPPAAPVEPEPEAPLTAAPDTTAPASSAAPPSSQPPGLSLLERAAAQRQQRLQELSAAPVPAEAASVPATAPSEPAAPPPAAKETSEPTLGAFDDTFTWSAEVLAAQGRRIEEISLEEIDWLGRLRQGLEKTRRNFVSQLLENLGDDPLTPEVLDDLETTLLRADVGVQATDQVLDALRRRLNEEVVDPAEGLRFLKQQLRDLLEAPIRASEAPLLAPERGRLNVWLMVGVNGVGKTTTLGKLANLAVRSGYSCLIAAADTFRAAAVQQVQVWGERSGVPVVSNPSSNADPAAVVYDAIGAAKARGTELVLVDTAGRLQTKHNLMEELSKVRRIIDRLAPEAVVESLLVLDASQGQNGLRQAMAFASAAGLTGVVITKLDGSARGGVALAVASEADLPIRFIGAGEGIRDLRPFNSFEFVEALLAGSR